MRRFSYFLLAACLCLPLVGCGDKAADSGDSGAAASEEGDAGSGTEEDGSEAKDDAADE